ncbi:hypothetical protein JAAARDRAFT_43849 [Jaapia argillacea MUCL 33604]|uniref:Uncharacterized protein n=1 Tax=Jaapia argillacea MUCL 33604 TaxID=933084 RepID=A0A067QQV0_9AGAM|nr:hypothetical protein JAAARDRAFT_43849 [Jaapia argillacea MUCL 33604]
MSFTVDDLVASFGSSHIGQEALDLAALQAQLTQTLFSAAQPRQEAYHAQPCNTPTASTPSSSNFNWGQIQMHRRSSSVASTSSRKDDRGDMDDMDEDERMVEELLWPSSPSTSSASHNQFPFNHSHSHSHPIPSPAKHRSPSYPHPGQQHFLIDPTPSTFTSTDPFYIAQMQAAQSNNSPQSFFSQAGRPSQHSPFLAAARGRSAVTSSAPVQIPMSVDTSAHTLLVATAAAFDR